ncbi:hypothetical protein EG68_07676, partial [Paragonimus skrjabini miyazakii]
DSYEKARRYEQRAKLESEFASTDAPDVDVPIHKKRIRRPRKMSSSEDENINLNPPPGGLFAYSPLKEINVVNRVLSVVSPGPSLPSQMKEHMHWDSRANVTDNSVLDVWFNIQNVYRSPAIPNFEQIPFEKELLQL